MTRWGKLGLSLCIRRTAWGDEFRQGGTDEV